MQNNMQWFEEFKKEGLFDESIFSAPAVKLSAERLNNAQKELMELPQRLKNAGIKRKDPVTVDVLTEFLSITEELHSANIQFASTVILEAIARKSN